MLLLLYKGGIQDFLWDTFDHWKNDRIVSFAENFLYVLNEWSLILFLWVLLFQTQYTEHIRNILKNFLFLKSYFVKGCQWLVLVKGNKRKFCELFLSWTFLSLAHISLFLYTILYFVDCMCVSVYVLPSWRLHRFGVGIPGDRSTMLCWECPPPLLSTFMVTLVWSTKPFQLAALSCSHTRSGQSHDLTSFM